mgnify:CR=1 FL=1
MGNRELLIKKARLDFAPFRQRRRGVQAHGQQCKILLRRAQHLKRLVCGHTVGKAIGTGTQCREQQSF